MTAPWRLAHRWRQADEDCVMPDTRRIFGYALCLTPGGYPAGPPGGWCVGLDWDDCDEVCTWPASRGPAALPFTFCERSD